MSEVNNTDVQDAPEEEISLIDLAIGLGEEKKTLVAVFAITTTLAIVVSLLMTPIFTAKTVMMPPQQQSGAASALASLGGLAGLAGAAGGIKSSDELYVAFMQSESLQNSVIEKFELKKRYEAKTMVDTRKVLKENVKITADKVGLIIIEANDKDPEFAAKLANAYVDELRILLGRLAVTDAQQRRKYLEEQIAKTQADLVIAESNFRSVQEKSGMQMTALIAEAGIKASAALRGQIATREVEMQAMSRFATAENPEMLRLDSELAAMRAKLNQIEQGSGDGLKASPNKHEAVLAYRELKARETMMNILMSQYETARVDEAKEGPLVQQVDIASVPERRAKPKRFIMVIVAAIVGLFLGLLIAFARRAIRKAVENPTNADQFTLLKEAWSWKV